MYEADFHLDRRPFAATPDPDCIAEVPTIVRALGSLERTLAGDAGLSVLTGLAGLGKTLVCRRLAANAPDDQRVAYVPSANFATRRAMLQSLLYELGEPYANRSEEELRLLLVAALRGIGANGGRAVLILDEAHLLAGRMLEELRLLTLEQTDSRPLASVLLSGQLELEETLAEPGLEAVNQRIRCQVILEPLTRDESRTYVAHRLKWAGGSLAACFDEEAIRLVCQVADGNPRALNQLCDHTLLIAHVDGRRPVDAACVTEAYEDLRQLPLHWNAPIVLGSGASEESPAEPEDVVECETVAPTEATIEPESFAPEPVREPETSTAVEVGWSSDEATVFETPPVESSVDTPPPKPVPAQPATFFDPVPSEPPAVPTQEPPAMPVFQSRQTVSVLDCFDDPVVWIEEPVKDTAGCRLERRVEPIARTHSDPPVPREENKDVVPVTADVAPEPVVEWPAVEPSSEVAPEPAVPVTPIVDHDEPEVVAFETPAPETYESESYESESYEPEPFATASYDPEPARHAEPVDEVDEVPSNEVTYDEVTYDEIAYDTVEATYEVGGDEEPVELESPESALDRVDDALPMLESALGSIVGLPTDEETVDDEDVRLPANDESAAIEPEPVAVESDDTPWRPEWQPVEDIEERIQRELSDIVAETSRAVTGERSPRVEFAMPTTELDTVEPEESFETDPYDVVEEFDVVEPETSTDIAAERLERSVGSVERPYARLFSEIRRDLRGEGAA